ncbi:MAG: hypothetical protein AB1670_23350, partial [Pseudomonadota bacterium]
MRHAKDESKRDFAKVYKGAGKSLKVNGIFSRRGEAGGLVYNEVHQTYHVYFHFKGEFDSEPADAEMISPLWLRTVDPEELPKLLNNYPV